MTSSGQNSHLFRWKRLGPTPDKMPVKTDDIDQWRKRVEKASEFAVSEVFFHKKPDSRSNRLAVPLQSSEQLKDHDDAYSEAQALLGDWLGTKLRMELEVDDEDDLRGFAETTQPAAPASPPLVVPAHNNLEDLYACLAEEEDHFAVNSFLQDLMEQELQDSRMMEELSLDDGEIQKKFRNPIITMEARHQQVRENRVRREAERRRQQREKEAQREARKEAKRREREEEMRKKLEQCKQEEMVQLEMVRLRRQMEERRGLEQLIRQRDREKAAQRAVRTVQTTKTLLSKQQQETERHHREQDIKMKIRMSNLKCLHSHFSGWYSVVMDQRLRTGKAVALCDWRRQLKAWRAWRTVMWAEREQQEMARTEETLRIENRQIQLAVESDRRRLLRRCLSEWQLRCQVGKAQRELLSRQQETKLKMAALLTAASTGKLLGTGASADQSRTVALAPPNQSEEMDQHRLDTTAPCSFVVRQDQTSVSFVSRPSQPWQITQRHAAPTTAELHEARQRVESGVFTRAKITASPAGRFENRHAVQQQIISQQRKLLKEQQEKIARLTEKQNMLGLELEMEKTAQLTQLSVLRGSRAKSCSFDPKEQRAPRVSAEPASRSAPSRKAVTQQMCPHPIISAMEARAQQRAERRKEIEELKRKKEDEKLAELKAAEEQRQREEEEEKRKAAEKRKEEKRMAREREEEKQRQQKRHQELMRLARQHYHRTLLSHRGLAPWKRLIQLRQASMELAERHHNLFLLRQYTLEWWQCVRGSVSEREACADQLNHHFLLRRSLNCWKMLRDKRMIQEERAERFYRRRTLRRFLLALLDHVTQERLMEWDRLQQAQEHRNRRILQRCLLAWTQLPRVLCRERERDKRREKLSRKIAEVLPDFCSYPSCETD